jgi:hypothetical protein
METCTDLFLPDLVDERRKTRTMGFDKLPAEVMDQICDEVEESNPKGAHFSLCSSFPD